MFRISATHLSLALLVSGFIAACGGGSDNSPNTSAPVAAPVAPTIALATGSGVSALPPIKGPMFDITANGAVSNGSALANQAAINSAIDAAAAAGGGTVVIPAGNF